MKIPFALSSAAWLALGILSANAAESGVMVTEADGRVRVTWPISSEENGSAVFSMDEAKPLIESFGIAVKGQQAEAIVSNLNPVTLLTVGSRDMENPAGWVAFFDNPPKRPHETFLVKLGKRSLHVTEEGARTTVSLAEVSGGNFNGEMQFTFYRNSAFLEAKAVMSTEENGRAIVYDAGLAGASPDWKSTVWNDTAEQLQRTPLDPGCARQAEREQAR